MKSIIYFGCVDNQRLIEAQFNSFNVKVVFIKEESEVIKKIMTDSPQAIVIDSPESRESFFDFLVKIKEKISSGSPKLKVVVFTRISYDTLLSRKDLVEFFHYVSKHSFNFTRNVVSLI